MKYFNIEEFESPDLKGSGIFMDKTFLSMINEARAISNIPFIITSGYRTIKHNNKIYKKLKKEPNKNSSHLKGLASDIRCTDSRSRFIIINALKQVGFTRIGIGDTFIHIDIDTYKSQNVIWVY